MLWSLPLSNHQHLSTVSFPSYPSAYLASLNVDSSVAPSPPSRPFQRILLRIKFSSFSSTLPTFLDCTFFCVQPSQQTFHSCLSFSCFWTSSCCLATCWVSSAESCRALGTHNISIQFIIRTTYILAFMFPAGCVQFTIQHIWPSVTPPHHVFAFMCTDFHRATQFIRHTDILHHVLAFMCPGGGIIECIRFGQHLCLNAVLLKITNLRL